MNTLFTLVIYVFIALFIVVAFNRHFGPPKNFDMVSEWVSKSIYTRRIINKKSLVRRSLSKQKCL